MFKTYPLNGTYLIHADGSIEDYAAKWSYGYIVAVEEIATIQHQHGDDVVSDWPDWELASWFYRDPHIGTWFDEETNVLCIDKWEHVDTIGEARELAARTNQKAIYDLRERKVITL